MIALAAQTARAEYVMVYSTPWGGLAIDLDATGYPGHTTTRELLAFTPDGKRASWGSSIDGGAGPNEKYVPPDGNGFVYLLPEHPGDEGCKAMVYLVNHRSSHATLWADVIDAAQAGTNIFEPSGWAAIFATLSISPPAVNGAGTIGGSSLAGWFGPSYDEALLSTPGGGGGEGSDDEDEEEGIIEAIEELQASIETFGKQVVFLLQVTATGIGALWGSYVWRLIMLAKNQSRFW